MRLLTATALTLAALACEGASPSLSDAQGTPPAAQQQLLPAPNPSPDAINTSRRTAITDADERRQARRRAQAMLYVVGTSPAFLVDR